MHAVSILSGVKVIEVAAYIPGPVCTQILADLGATVIKVERPEGDPMRHMAPRTPDGSANPIFLAFNRNKQIVNINLKTPEGVAALRNLAEDADVLVDGFRPGVLARLGVGAEQLRARNPRLIYCALSGYGDTSPLRDVAGHDINYVALSGFLSLTMANGAPAMPGTQLADMLGGLTAATAILAALHERNHSGAGATLDIALSDAALWLMNPWLATQQSGQPVTTERGNMLAGSLACYRLYRTADERYLAVGALEPNFWTNFCNALGRPDLIAAQYSPPAQPTLIAAISAIIAAEPLAHWEALFSLVDACVTPTLTMEEAIELPLHRERGLMPEGMYGAPLPIGKR